MGFEGTVEGRRNNISLLRFFAAVLVVFSHSWPLTGNGADWLDRHNGGRLSFGALAVIVFFFYGGFLIMKTVGKNQGTKAYFKARCLRIFPALWLVVALSAFCLGPVLTTWPHSAYFSSVSTWTYLLNGALIPVHRLPGVFENNPYGAAVNGSLWTLSVEFLCYVFCYCFYRAGLSKRHRALFAAVAIVGTAALSCRVLPDGLAILRRMFRPFVFFLAGMLCQLFWDKIPKSGMALLISAGLFLASAFLGFAWATVYVTLPYILLYLGFANPTKLSGFCNRHEISYGLYLTAFPIQQTVAGLRWPLSPGAFFLVTALLAMGAGWGVTKAERWIVRKVAE